MVSDGENRPAGEPVRVDDARERLAAVRARAEGPGAPGIRVSVLYEDEWLIAVDKPAGIIVHGDGTGAETLTDLVRTRLETEGDATAASQLQAVQRLDRDTTGVVLFSKDKSVQGALDAALAGRAVGTSAGGPDAASSARKRYLAVVRGEFPWRSRTFDGSVARDRHDARRMRVGRTGKSAQTRVERLAVSGPRAGRRSLLLVELVTGRRHQIRVHLAHAGFPILGDELYGVPADRSPRVPGLMLHAWEERLTHPVTGERLVVRAPCPERFRALFPDVDGLAR